MHDGPRSIDEDVIHVVHVIQDLYNITTSVRNLLLNRESLVSSSVFCVLIVIGPCPLYVPSKGTAEAVGGAASTRISNSNRRLPKIVKPVGMEKRTVTLI